jgi:hypothetical protein
MTQLLLDLAAVAQNIAHNRAIVDGSTTQAQVLLWSESGLEQFRDAFDIVIAADWYDLHLRTIRATASDQLAIQFAAIRYE